MENRRLTRCNDTPSATEFKEKLVATHLFSVVEAHHHCLIKTCKERLAFLASQGSFLAEVILLQMERNTMTMLVKMLPIKRMRDRRIRVWEK